MLHDPRQSFAALTDSPDLDKLLSKAREKVATSAPTVAPTVAAVTAVDKAAVEAQKIATDLAASFNATATEGAINRAQKVAMVRHMVDAGARVLA